MDIILFAEARSAGLRHYYTGKPCRHGHVAKRFVVNKVCVQCTVERAVRERIEDPVRVKERFRRHHQANRSGRINYSAQWRRQNLARYNLMMRGRSKKVRQATPRWLTLEQKAEIREIYASCPEGHQVDHIVPINHPLVCGLHVPWNLQHLTAAANLAKSNSFTVL